MESAVFAGEDKIDLSIENTIEISENIEKIFNSTLFFYLYFLVSVIFFPIISFLVAFITKRYIFPILFLFFSIPVIAGVTLLGIRRGLARGREGIKGLILTLRRIYNENTKGEKYAYKDAKKMFKIIIKTTILPVLKIYCDKIWFMGGFVYSSIARILTKSAKVFLKSDGITPKGNITDDKVLEAGKKIYGTVEELRSKIVKGAEIALLVLGIVFTSLVGVMLLILVIFRIIWKF